MNGIRHFLREFTASAVKEHLRSQLDSAPDPELTTNEVDLVQFVLQRSSEWNALALGRATD